ncbi:MAG TPA: beta-ketoacyl-[acyl-carrier-protein] synthase family protein [Ktedonobacteraceae bacterium]|jgi:3-oxoacyl-(acyl-carrier-protein) synthase|nr:beta-ketoacyl-[acyl-carrier-protein] synthase family protein [Ktedonobacteraceae bacterium]
MSETMTHSLRRVVISGLGVVAPNGIGKEAFWQAIINGTSGISKITRFDASLLPSQIAGEVEHFIPQHYGLSTAEVVNCNRGTQLALAASELALADAHFTVPLSQAERERTGVYMGSAMAYAEEGEKLWLQATARGQHDAYFSAQFDLDISTDQLMMHASASNIASHYYLHGPCMVLATGCSAGADAIGEAFWMIQEGRADRMLAGGCDSAITPMSLGVFCVMGAISTNYNDHPTQASRPYDQRRDGFVMAEGAAVLLLEERELALARGAHIYAEILTFSSNSSAHHMTSLPADGAPLQQLLQQVLHESDIPYEQIHYINAHGSSTQPNEIAETAAYKAVFGPYAYHIPISATKSTIGHSQGAASAIETLVTALVLERQIIPPTINLDYADPLCDLDYVPNTAREARVELALTHSSGFGGVNSALILARADWKK